MASTATLSLGPNQENEVQLLPPKEEKTLDNFMKLGKYCWLILLFSEFMLLSGAGNTLYMMYAGAIPKQVSCEGPDVFIKDICDSSYDFHNPPNCTITSKYDFYSINVDFGHFCGEGAWVKTSISVQMVGVLIGSVTSGAVADRYGRLKVLSVCFFMVSSLSIVNTFVKDLIYFTIVRTLLSVFKGGLLSTYGVYKMEHVPRQHRFWIATMISWAPNYMLLSLVAYLCHDWITYQYAIFALSMPGALVFMFVQESPRWLIQAGRIDDARRVLKRIMEVDGNTSDHSWSEIEEMLQTEQKRQAERTQKRKNYDFRHLFWNKYMASVTMIMWLGMFSTSFTNYGFVFNIEKLSGSLYINALLMGTLRWMLNIAFGVADIKFKGLGRKHIHLISKLTITVCVFSIFITYYFEYEEEYSLIIRIATLLASATASQVFITKSMVLMEFYPTVIRNSAVSFKSSASRIGTILGPQLFILCPYKSLPYAVLTVMCLFDAIAFQVQLPETKGRPLPETMPERQKNGRTALPTSDPEKK
ncbi:hypothetical protein GCK72_018555 [Caenorhabditis remanei]|uniref:Major facilitator superfamily (MFS) profile domain-containing protein n=1 Tax=Caenorhabditis remanei TaxID=31234 RepID=A0A6A5GB56_CAERE|nr:hypothetical protein GCK72_018555 [Caenorhabditis remanei]KAF1752001.1 hypothetical protein GCK72_018555 [Caenorhabditis remanei]